MAGFEGETVLWAVRWYARHGISYRDLEQQTVAAIVGTARGGAQVIAVAEPPGTDRSPFVLPVSRALSDERLAGVVSTPIRAGAPARRRPSEPAPGAEVASQARAWREMAKRSARTGRACVLVADGARALSEEALRTLAEALDEGGDGGTFFSVLAGEAPREGSLGAGSPDLGPLTPEQAGRHLAGLAASPGDDLEAFDAGAVTVLHGASGGWLPALDALASVCLAARADRGPRPVGDVEAREAVRDAISWRIAIPESAPPRTGPSGGSPATEAPAAGGGEDGRPGARAAPPAANGPGPIDAPRPEPEEVPLARPPARDAAGADADADADAVERLAPGPPDDPQPERDDGRDEAAAGGRRRPAVWIAAGTALCLAAGGLMLARTAPWSVEPPGTPPAAEAPAPQARSAAEPRGTRYEPLGDAIPSQGAAGRILHTSALDLAPSLPRDAVIAYARAALRGHARSAYYLGQMFEAGIEVEANPGLARAWYEAAGRDGAARRIEVAEAPADGPDGVPEPLFSGRLPGEAAEFVWDGVPGARAYEVEFARDRRSARAAGHVETPLSGVVVDLPGDLVFWRVGAVGGEGRTDWMPIGTPAAAARPLSTP